MTKYQIRGGKELRGEVEISGAKNAAVAIIPATLLVSGTCRIENLPQISDVFMLLNIPYAYLTFFVLKFDRSREEKAGPKSPG